MTRLRTAVPIALAAVIVAASTAATAALITHDSATPGPTTPPPLRNAAWTVDAPRGARTLTTMSGAWVTQDTVVRGSADGLHAFHRKDGTTAWDWPVPFPDGAVCSMSPTPDAGIGIVSMTPTPSSQCTKIAALDLPTGKVLWTADAPTVFADPAADAPSITADAGMAILQSSHPTKIAAVALNAHTGKLAWTQTTPCPHSVHSAMLSSQGRTALAQNCPSGASVLTLDSATGTPLTTYTSPALKSDPGLVALTPLTAVNDITQPTTIAMAPPATTPTTPLTDHPTTDLDTLFNRLSPLSLQYPRAASSPTLVCLSGTPLQCVTPTGAPVPLKGYPTPLTATVPIQSPDNAVHLLVLPTPNSPRALVIRIDPTGKITPEAELSLPISKFLTASTAPQLSAYGTASDLVLIAHLPASADTAIIAVR